MPDWKFLYHKYGPTGVLSQFWPTFSQTCRLDGLVFHYPSGFQPQNVAFFNEVGQESYDVLLSLRGDTAIDIGSGIGSYALRLAGQFNRVFAFEPNPFVAKYLKRNIERNRKANVIAVQSAISDKTEMVELRLPSKFSSASTLSQNHYSRLKFKDRVVVRAFSLDDYFRSYKGRIDLVKIDAEGHELVVLNGAREIMRNYHPLMAVEVHRSPETLLGCNCQVCRWLKAEYPGQVELHGRYAPEMEVHWTICYPSS